MENTESVSITFRVSPEQARDIDAKAEAAGQTRAEYVRNLVLAGDNSQQVVEVTQQFAEVRQQFAELQTHYGALVERLATMTAEQENRKCTNPTHAETFGVGHCFLCDLPIASER